MVTPPACSSWRGLKDVVARVSDELYRIARALETSADLRLTLSDPRLPLERKHGVVADLLGGRVLPLTLNLVNFVVAAGHSRDLPAIADELAARAAAERDRVIAEVRTAFELDEATVQRLAEALSRATGKQVEVKTVVDPSLVGRRGRPGGGHRDRRHRCGTVWKGCGRRCSGDRGRAHPWRN